MYYECVRFKPLEIPLHDPSQFTHAKQCLAEVETTIHPVFPDMEFSWTEYRAFGSYKIAVQCARQTTTISEEFGRQLDRCIKTDVNSARILSQAVQEAYYHCLGCSKLDIWIPRAPPDFWDAIYEEYAEDRTWVVRNLSLRSDCWRYPCISMFTDLAICKNGDEWGTRDLRYIIESLEDFVGKPRQQHR